MKIFHRQIDSIGNEIVRAAILEEVETALHNVSTVNGRFVVNDTEWFWQNPAGKIKPSVVNSAKFITNRFQAYLHDDLGWIPEKKISDQAVDAYKEFEANFHLYSIPEEAYLELLDAYQKLFGKSAGPIATSIHQKYCDGGSAELNKHLLSLEHFFERKLENKKLRVAIEFETGNIASSFRAANKLEYLFNEGKIDLGIFITSNDKPNCAARIWPVTNRNGSFQELENRGFGASLTVPIWFVGFEPDEFDRSAPYLAEDGTTYQLKNTERKIEVSGKRYEIWKDLKNQDRLRSID